MNVPFQSLPFETQMQVVIAYADMALVSVGRLFQAIAPLAAVALLIILGPVFVRSVLTPSNRGRRRILR